MNTEEFFKKPEVVEWVENGKSINVYCTLITPENYTMLIQTIKEHNTHHETFETFVVNKIETEFNNKVAKPLFTTITDLMATKNELDNTINAIAKSFESHEKVLTRASIKLDEETKRVASIVIVGEQLRKITSEIAERYQLDRKLEELIDKNTKLEIAKKGLEQEIIEKNKEKTRSEEEIEKLRQEKERLAYLVKTSPDTSEGLVFGDKSSLLREHSKLSDELKEVYNLLWEGKKAKDIAEIKKVTNPAITYKIKELIAAGLVEKQGGGSNTRFICHLKPSEAKELSL